MRSSPLTATQDNRRGGRRFYDAAQAAWVVKILPGEFYADRRSEEVLVTVLGSCVVGLHSRSGRGQVGGMNHFMLRQNKSGSGGAGAMNLNRRGSAISPWRNWSMTCSSAAAQRERMEIKVFGGANVTSTRNEIGTDNGEFVLRYLKAEGLPCAAADLGGVLSAANSSISR